MGWRWWRACGTIDATCDRTTYVATGTEVVRRRGGEELGRGLVGSLPPSEPFVRVARGDRVRIRRDLDVGHPADIAADGTVRAPATIGCDLPSVFDAVAVGHRVLIDDGRIEGVVDRVDAGSFDVLVSRPAAGKLKAGKGINQVLWLCEAAHIPVIWATQVVESLAKQGIPTRAEVTDAAWASRAECVMLNKGPHVVEAMRFLDDVVARMREHQEKRTPLLRRLSVSTALEPPVATS